MEDTVLIRFLAKIQVEPNGCWLWTANRHNGYGRLSVGGRQGHLVRAHRLSYEHWVGPILPGLELDHQCRVKACVNPDHIEAVTHQANMHNVDWNRRRPATCPKGHSDFGMKSSGRRYCKVCYRNYKARRADTIPVGV